VVFQTSVAKDAGAGRGWRQETVLHQGLHHPYWPGRHLVCCEDLNSRQVSFCPTEEVEKEVREDHVPSEEEGRITGSMPESTSILRSRASLPSCPKVQALG